MRPIVQVIVAALLLIVAPDQADSRNCTRSERAVANTRLLEIEDSPILKERLVEYHAPWRSNVLVHDYFEIDLEVVWSVGDQDLPRFVTAVDRMTHVASTRRP